MTNQTNVSTEQLVVRVAKVEEFVSQIGGYNSRTTITTKGDIAANFFVGGVSFRILVGTHMEPRFARMKIATVVRANFELVYTSAFKAALRKAGLKNLHVRLSFDEVSNLKFTVAVFRGAVKVYQTYSDARFEASEQSEKDFNKFFTTYSASLAYTK